LHAPASYAFERGVAIFLERERTRPAAFDRVAETMQRTDAGIAAPREDQTRRASCADQLIADQVGRHSYQREVAPALPDHFVRSGERDKVSESLDRHRVAVADSRDRVGQ
jgi:hypothetical protein